MAAATTTQQLAVPTPIKGVIKVVRVRESRANNGLEEDKVVFTVLSKDNKQLTFMWTLRDFVYHMKLNNIGMFIAEPQSFQDLSVRKAIERFKGATIEGMMDVWSAGNVYLVGKKSTKLIVGHKNYDPKLKATDHLPYEKDGYKLIDEPVIEQDSKYIQIEANAEAKAESDHQRASLLFVVDDTQQTKED